MATASRFTDHDIIERYTDQPARLPDAARTAALAGAPQRIDAYTFADLNANLTFAQNWLVLGSLELIVVHRVGTDAPRVERFARAGLGRVLLSTGLSCHILRVYGKNSVAPLVEARFTHRQRRSMEGLSFLLEQVCAGKKLEPRDPDRYYAETVSQPIKDAQALVSKHQLGVVWRLLSYLGPYRRQVALGMSAAAAVTLLSLAPPLITGRLIDHVVRPVQAGELRAEDVMRTAWLAVLGLACVQARRAARPSARRTRASNG